MSSFTKRVVRDRRRRRAVLNPHIKRRWKEGRCRIKKPFVDLLIKKRRGKEERYRIKK